MDYSTTICEYCDCLKPSTTLVVLDGTDYPVCEEHAESAVDETGYCGVSCMLGYGCDLSC